MRSSWKERERSGVEEASNVVSGAGSLCELLGAEDLSGDGWSFALGVDTGFVGEYGHEDLRVGEIVPDGGQQEGTFVTRLYGDPVSVGDHGAGDGVEPDGIEWGWLGEYGDAAVKIIPLGGMGGGGSGILHGGEDGVVGHGLVERHCGDEAPDAANELLAVSPGHKDAKALVEDGVLGLVDGGEWEGVSFAVVGDEGSLERCAGREEEPGSGVGSNHHGGAEVSGEATACQRVAAGFVGDLEPRQCEV